MQRWTALLLVMAVSCGSPTHAVEPADNSFAPAYEGTHVLPSLRLAGLPGEPQWSEAFQFDTGIVLNRNGWYLAEITPLLDESGQVRDAFLTESIPSRNLSATTVEEFRHKKWVAALGPNGPVPGLFSMRLVYILQQSKSTLGGIAGRLRRAADKGDAHAQYILSRLLLAYVDFNRNGLDSEALLRQASEAGNAPAMLVRGLMTPEAATGTDPAATLAERRRWLLKAAQTGSGVAQLLVALDAWAERTDQGYTNAGHWLELAKKADEPGAGKYLAALLVSHSTKSADWKLARELAQTASREWHDRRDPDTWQILAAACALTGDFNAAIEAQTRAAELAAKNGWPSTPFETRLLAYQASRTVTEELVVIPAVAHVVTPAPRLAAQAK